MAPRQPLSGLLIVRKGWPQRAWRAGGSMEKPITADFTYWIGCVQRFGPHIGGGECLVDLAAFFGGVTVHRSTGTGTGTGTGHHTAPARPV
jgi:hypothetical protein